VIADTTTFAQLENWLFGAFAVAAVLLAAVGLYGLITHEVELSTREIGVRLALGATRGMIRRQIFRRVSWMLTIGVSLGLLVTGATERLINSVVPIEIERNAMLILALALGLALLSWGATAMPAWRASRIEPMTALRDE
jgi:putative ABC transport system permease protein